MLHQAGVKMIFNIATRPDTLSRQPERKICLADYLDFENEQTIFPNAISIPADLNYRH